MNLTFPYRAARWARVLLRAPVVWLALLIAGCQAGGELGDPPAAPQMSATPGDRSVRVEWEAVEGAGAYYLYLAEPQQAFAPAVQSRRTVTSPAVVDGLTNGTTYHLWLTAVGPSGQSTVSQVHAVTPQPPPVAPQNVTVATGNGSVGLQWDPPAGAETYRVYRVRGVQPLGGDVASAPGFEGLHNSAAPSFTADGLDNGVEYSFVITAVNQSGESAPSAVVAATPGPFRAVSIGGNHGCVVDAKAQMWCWGSNAGGQVDGATGGRMLEPVQVGGIATWKTVSVGFSNTCGVTTDESIICWGNGTGATVVAERPNSSRTPLATERWVALAAGSNTNCAVRGDGSLWCWANGGAGASQQLTRLGFASDWIDVAVGTTHLCARKQDLSLWCWGDNSAGQLGTGNLDRVDRPVWIPLAGKAKKVSLGLAVGSGSAHTCEIDADDQLWCWGSNGSGQLGTAPNDTSFIAQPARMGDGASWRDVVAANAWTCGVKLDGTLWCWGDNAFGQWGGAPRLTSQDQELIQISLPGVTEHPAPVPMPPPLLRPSFDHGEAIGACSTCHNGKTAMGKSPNHFPTTNACEQCHSTSAWIPQQSGASPPVSVNSSHVHALATLGGDESIGTEAIHAPRQIGSENDWVAVYAGEQHNCASKRDGSLWCLGRSQLGQLGIGGDMSAQEPPMVLDEAQSLVTRGVMSCALRLDQTLWCWGDLSTGAAAGQQFQVPTQVGASGRFTKIFGTGNGVCALTAADQLWCLGGGLSRGPSFASLRHRADGLNVVKLTAGRSWWGYGRSLCGIDSGGRLGCVVAEFDNQGFPPIAELSALMRDGTVPQTPQISAVVEQGLWAEVEVGSEHLCAIDRFAKLVCRGGNGFGQLGTALGQGQVSGGLDFSAEFIEPLAGVSVQDLAVGDYHTCAIGLDAGLTCWGWMKLSTSAGPSTDQAKFAPSGAWRSVEAGTTNSCGIQTDGSLWCWGYGSYDASFQVTPVWATGSSAIQRIGQLNDWIAVSSSDGFACGLRSGGQVHCWGVNNMGQLGNGQAWLTEFAKVRFPDAPM